MSIKARESMTGPMHRASMEAIRSGLSAANVLTDFCAEQLTKRGVDVSPQRLAELRDKFSQPLENLHSLTLDWDDIDESKVSLNLNPDEVLRFAQDRYEGSHKFVQKTVDWLARRQYEFVKQNASLLLRDHTYATSGLAANREWVWGEALDGLLGFVCSNEAFVSEISARLVKWRRGHERTRQLTLLRLQARACQVAKEIVVLLRSGYADGAFARWRTLHEICITVEFLLKAKSEVSQMYVDHAEVGRLKAMREAHNADLGKRRLRVTKRDLANQEKMTKSLCTKWSQKFAQDNGWAATTLGKEKPTFKQIEDYAGSGYARLQYKLASQQVHSHALAFEMRPSTGADYGHILLTGPTNHGLEDPAKYTTLSILHLTVLLAAREDADIDSLVICKCFSKQSREVIQRFYDAASVLTTP